MLHVVTDKRQTHVLDFLILAVLWVHGAAFACAGDWRGAEGAGAGGLYWGDGGGIWRGEAGNDGVEEAEEGGWAGSGHLFGCGRYGDVVVVGVVEFALRTIIGDVEVEIGWLELCCAALSCDVVHNLTCGCMCTLVVR